VSSSARCEVVMRSQAVRSTSLLKLENRNRTRLVQKPNYTRFMGKSENVYSGTRTFWLFRDQTNRNSVYRSTHFHFCPLVSVQFGFCTNLVRFRVSSLNKLFARTAWDFVTERVPPVVRRVENMHECWVFDSRT